MRSSRWPRGPRQFPLRPYTIGPDACLHELAATVVPERHSSDSPPTNPHFALTQSRKCPFYWPEFSGDPGLYAPEPPAIPIAPLQLLLEFQPGVSQSIQASVGGSVSQRLTPSRLQ